MKFKKMAETGNKLRVFMRRYHDESQYRPVVVGDGKEEYSNNKTGRMYIKVGNVINCTNKNDGQEMVLYTDCDKFYVRDVDEFEEKFTRER